MLIDENEASKRLNNPLNLINRMKSGMLSNNKKNDAMSLFVKVKEESVVLPSDRVEIHSFSSPLSPIQRSLPVVIPATNETTESSPSSDDLIKDSESRIKLAVVEGSAIDLLTTSLVALKRKVDSGDIKTSSIPSVISASSKVITEIRKERLEREKNKSETESVHYHFYCPEPRKIETYDVIEVG